MAANIVAKPLGFVHFIENKGPFQRTILVIREVKGDGVQCGKCFIVAFHIDITTQGFFPCGTVHVVVYMFLRYKQYVRQCFRIQTEFHQLFGFLHVLCAHGKRNVIIIRIHLVHLFQR